MRLGSWPVGRGERLGPSLWEEASEGLCFSGRGAAVAAGPGEKRVARSPRPGRRLSWSSEGVEAARALPALLTSCRHTQPCAPGSFSLPAWL